MDIGKKIDVFSRLGKVLSRLGAEEDFSLLEKEGWDSKSFEKSFYKAVNSNSWFSPESIYRALFIIGVSLDREDLERWAKMYDLNSVKDQKTVAVVMAGNIPAVGFHDFLSVLMSGHKILAKHSSSDQYLIPTIAELLISADPEFSDLIEFTDETIKNFDAVIATGSNNSARYFNHYFGKYPHIIRKNRNALAVLTGDEDAEDFKSLGDDIFMYYGLGCRNVSKIFVPGDYDFVPFFEGIEAFAPVGNHHKYANNYDYNKSILLVNGVKHFDNGFLLIREAPGMASPVSVLHYERYAKLDEVNNFIREESENIQCVISASPAISNAIPPGTGQYPKLWDYADGVDTMEFLVTGF